MHLRRGGPIASRVGLVCSFLFAAALRATPELIAWPRVMGYDVVAFYAPVLAYFDPTLAHLRLLVLTPNNSPLVYLMLIPFARLLGVFPVLRAWAVLAYGLLGAAVFLFAQRHMEWSPKAAFFASILASTYFVTLRIGLDLLKNLFGLVLVLAILALMRGGYTSTRTKVLITSLWLVLAATHEMSALILLFVTLGLATLDLFGGRRRLAWNMIACSLPAILLLAVLILMGSGTEYAFASAKGVTVYFLPLKAQGTPTSPFVNYLEQYGSYSALLMDVPRFFLFLYLPILPLVFAGLNRDRVLALLTLSAVPGSFSLLAFPSVGLGFWYRWMLILTIPFTLYGAVGSMRLIRHIRSMRRRIYAAATILLLLGSLGFSFAIFPPEAAQAYFSPPELRPYFPSSMLTSSIPLNDEQDAIALFEQLNMMMADDSVLLVHESFFGWASLALTANATIINYHLGQPTEALPLAKQLAFTHIYWVWWLPGYEWHNYRAPLNLFKPIRQSGHLAIFIYSPS